MKYQRTGLSFIVKEGGGGKSSCIFTIGPVGHLVLFFLSERKSWNQPTEIYLPVKQEDCLYVVWIAVCSLVWMASRSPNFTPQRCRSRSRRTQGVGWVAVGVVGLQKGRVPSSQCGCNVEKQRFFFGTQVQPTPACVPSTLLNYCSVSS